MFFIPNSKYSIPMEIHPRMAWIYQIADICQRWGGVGLRGVSRMDAADKPTGTYLRRPRNPTPPRHPTEPSCCRCFGRCCCLCGYRAQPGRTPLTATAAQSCPAAAHAHPCAG
ncbi:hypothetical protein CR156_12070 [Stenotrophomonas lactitubi]|nr:hypothetical protein CR156_12070 [Stenotrophomonas lactitubi]